MCSMPCANMLTVNLWWNLISTLVLTSLAYKFLSQLRLLYSSRYLIYVQIYGQTLFTVTKAYRYAWAYASNSMSWYAILTHLVVFHWTVCICIDLSVAKTTAGSTAGSKVVCVRAVAPHQWCSVEAFTLFGCVAKLFSVKRSPVAMTPLYNSSCNLTDL